MSEPILPSGPLSDWDYMLAMIAVERGWVTKEQVEAALVARDREPGTRLLDHLPLSPGQLIELEALASSRLGPSPTAQIETKRPPEGSHESAGPSQSTTDSRGDVQGPGRTFLDIALKPEEPWNKSLRSPQLDGA